MRNFLAALFTLGVISSAYGQGAGSPIYSTSNTDILADISAQNGTCNDASGNAHNCIISGTPTYVASLASANNQPAWTLNGTTANYFIINDGRTVSGLGQGYYGGANYAFTPPTGDWGAILVVDLNASQASGSFYTLMASGGSVPGGNGWVFGVDNQNYYFATPSCGVRYFGGPTISMTGPHVISFAWSGVLQQVSVCIDGCSGGWVDNSYAGSTQTGNYSAASTDGTLMIGGTPNSANCGSVTNNPWYGHLLRFALYKESPRTPGKDTLWKARRDAMRTLFGTP